ncbi:LuxR C-terminal-related transcriptional regulator [Streptomonospora sediminis]
MIAVRAGRERELALLGDAVAAAARGRGSLTLIGGPLGIGRSALLECAGGLAADGATRVLAAAVPPHGSAGDFATAVRLLAPAVAPAADGATQRRSMFSGAAQAVLPLFEPAASGTAAAPERAPAVHGLRSLLARVCADGPLVLLVDDLQWADTPSLAWLRDCVREISRLPIALIGTVRDGDPASGRATVRELASSATWRLLPAPLSAEESAAVLRDRFGADAGADLAAACHTASSGIPLVLRALEHDLAIRGPAATAPERVADGLAARSWYLRERVAGALRESPQLRECAMAVAVLGSHARPALVEHVAGGDPIAVSDACMALRRLGLLAPGDRLRFSTPVFGETIAELMAAADHERLQLRAARALHDCGHPADAVAERLLTIPLDSAPHWALEELRAAADSAVQDGDPHRAADYLRALPAAAHGAGGQGRRLVDLASAEARFDAAAALRHIGQAVRLLPSPQEQADAVGTLPVTALRGAGGPPAAAVARAAGHGTGHLAHTAHLGLEARQRFASCADPGAVHSAVRRLDALGTAPGVATAAERELLAVLLYAATVAAEAGAPRIAALAERLLEREPALHGGTGGTAALALVSAIAAGSPAYALSWLDSALQPAAQPHSYPAGHGALLGLRAVALARMGRFAAARAAAWELHQDSGGDLRGAAGAPLMAVAAVAMDVRDEHLARAALAACGDVPAGGAGMQLQATAELLRGSLAAGADPGTALEHFLACGRILHRADWQNPVLFPWRTRAARLLHRLGDAGSALEMVEQEHGYARRWGAPEAVGRTLRAKAALVAAAEAGPLLDEAVEVLRSADDRPGLAKALLEHGIELRNRGMAAQAEERLGESYRLAVSCGAQWLAERALAAADRPAAVPADATGLSKSERWVAELALQGLTNVEIAAQLQVTRRAVEKHLTNCYRKFGISGRAELRSAFGNSAPRRP